MANLEERIRRVLKGLEVCGSEPEFMEDCEKRECPYVNDDMSCVSRLARDARAVILEMDKLLQSMEEAKRDDP